MIRTLAGYKFRHTHLRIDQLEMLAQISETQLKRYFAGEDCLSEAEVAKVEQYLFAGHVYYLRWRYEAHGLAFDLAHVEANVERVYWNLEIAWEAMYPGEGVTRSPKYGRVVLSKELGKHAAEMVNEYDAAGLSGAAARGMAL